MVGLQCGSVHSAGASPSAHDNPLPTLPGFTHGDQSAAHELRQGGAATSAAEDHLALERSRCVKHEYVLGQVYALKHTHVAGRAASPG